MPWFSIVVISFLRPGLPLAPPAMSNHLQPDICEMGSHPVRQCDVDYTPGIFCGTVDFLIAAKDAKRRRSVERHTRSDMHPGPAPGCWRQLGLTLSVIDPL